MVGGRGGGLQLPVDRQLGPYTVQAEVEVGSSSMHAAIHVS